MSSLRDLLLDLRDREGYIDPPLIVEAARPHDAPLHNRFEWDDSVAAECYRVDQAHRLIQSVRVSYTNKADEPVSIRAFVAVPRADSSRPVYEPVEEAFQDEMTRKIVLQDMEREWKAFRARYGQLAEFAALVSSTAREAAA